ncbi:MAG TPA: phage holin family protein [Devosia sp.]|nr:phage holin family protein [Devosia sp.]
MADNPRSSTAEIIGALAIDIIDLLRKELALAQAEASDQLARMRFGIGMLAVAGVLGIYGLGLLLASFVDGLAAAFEAMGQGQSMARLFGGLAVALVVAVIAAILAGLGARALQKAQAGLKRTGSELARDVSLARETLDEHL